MKIQSGYKVEYTDNDDEICIIPWPAIPFEDFNELIKMYIKLGYICWHPSDERRGFIFSKKKKELDQ